MCTSAMQVACIEWASGTEVASERTLLGLLALEVACIAWKLALSFLALDAASIA